MRAILVGQKLHIVNQQQVQRVVALLELFKRLALVSLDHIGDKLFCVNVQHLGRRVVGHQLVADGVHQVGFSQANAAINEQRVVLMPQTAGHMQGCRPPHAVGRAFDQRVKGQRGIQPVLENFFRGLFRFSRNRQFD